MSCPQWEGWESGTDAIEATIAHSVCCCLCRGVFCLRLPTLSVAPTLPVPHLAFALQGLKEGVEWLVGMIGRSQRATRLRLKAPAR